ncbi:MAG: DUF3291 domain-containing protein [Sinimarinibacterium sp.]|jgi:hypothetical protein
MSAVPTDFHLAQVNIARIKAPSFEDPAMLGFVSRVPEINALADASEGFIWRLPQGEDDVYLRPYDDPRLLFNLSVWESIEHLQAFVYRSTHVDFLRQREQWFEALGQAHLALWWIPADHHPGVDEANDRLSHLRRHGPTAYAFTPGRPFPAGLHAPMI